ncbi:GNAT family N-acetyltransferase [Yoonia sp. SDW83-1]|uniref:GNAT family N-acetyltransferase n=1 Tax=Yoonia sp. SDW83-1 TaxID=3366945 RepID=UPI00398C3DF4
MTFDIRRFEERQTQDLINLSIRAWTPVFVELMTTTSDQFVLNAFYPSGWKARQVADIQALLEDESCTVWTAQTDDHLVGFIGLRSHPEDAMGEIHIIAVDPDQQRNGVATALMSFASDEFRRGGLKMVMVETGGDPGHEPSRAAYESFGFHPWPVARYFKEL